MHLVYVLLSPTFGMHQYTADLANRVASAGHEVHLVTTCGFPRDRYCDAIHFHTPVAMRGTGLNPEGLGLRALRVVEGLLLSLEPDVAHFTGPHLWNVALLRALRLAGVPALHTIHDLDPHIGAGYGALLHLWNRLVIAQASHILVHGASYRQRLLAMGVPSSKVTNTPLLHLFLGHTRLEAEDEVAGATYGNWALFFGRLERYKGLDYLLTAGAMMNGHNGSGPRVIIAGPGRLDRQWAGPLPRSLELRNRLVEDDEATDLFRRCGLLVLPYIDATQSALIAAAYYYRKPVLVTRTGALPEYVEDGVTGCVVEPGHAASLARALDEMLADPRRLAEMGAAGRAWYDGHRTQETETLFALYETLKK